MAQHQARVLSIMVDGHVGRRGGVALTGSLPISIGLLGHPPAGHFHLLLVLMLFQIRHLRLATLPTCLRRVILLSSRHSI